MRRGLVDSTVVPSRQTHADATTAASTSSGTRTHRALRKVAKKKPIQVMNP